MTILFSDGAITTSASEQTIFDVTADEHFAAWIFAHNMASGDTVVIKTKVLDQNTSTIRTYETVTLTDAQTDPAYFIAWLPARQYRVTIQRTAGTDRSFTWLRAEVV